MYVPSCSPPGQGVMATNLLSVIAPRIEPSCTNSCVMIPIFQDGSLPFQYTHKHSSPLRQALHTQIANHHIQRARNSFYLFYKVGGFLQSSAQPHESAPIPLQCPLGTEGWDGQVGQRTVLRDTMGHLLMSHMPLGD